MATMRSVLRNAGRALLILIGAAVALLVILAITHQVATAVERRTHPARGELVLVNGGRMHVYSEGNGARTVLLMSGLGAACPSMDFRPLALCFFPPALLR